MSVPIQAILKEIGSRVYNIGTIVDTDETNDETLSYAGKMINGAGAGNGIASWGKNTADAKNASSNISSNASSNISSNAKNAKDVKSAISAKDIASAMSDSNTKDISENVDTASIIERAYRGLDDIIYKYNSMGQALGEDDKLRAGITAQSMEGGILESAVVNDPNTGYKMVDTRHLALANAAAIKEIFERLDRIEGKGNEL